MADLSSTFELLISKMKQPKETDFVQPEVPSVLQPEIDEIDQKNDELADAELWNTESLCFRY